MPRTSSGVSGADSARGPLRPSATRAIGGAATFPAKRPPSLRHLIPLRAFNRDSPWPHRRPCSARCTCDRRGRIAATKYRCNGFRRRRRAGSSPSPASCGLCGRSLRCRRRAPAPRRGLPRVRGMPGSGVAPRPGDAGVGDDPARFISRVGMWGWSRGTDCPPKSARGFDNGAAGRVYCVSMSWAVP